MTKKSALIAFGIILALFLVEFYLRASSPSNLLSYTPAGSFSCYKPGTYYWANLKSNASCILHSNFGEFQNIKIKINSLGLRNSEISKKNESVKRILFIGDSFTFGWGVKDEESYPRLTQKRLNERGLKAESINAARPSNSPGNYYLYLIKQGLELSPDIVVVGFDVFNDISNHNEVWIEKDSNGLPQKIGNSSYYVDPQGNLREGKIPLKFRIPVLKYSYVFTALMDIIDPQTKINDRETNINNNTINKIEFLFKSMNEELKKRGGRLIIVMIPYSIQIDENVRREHGLPPIVSSRNPVYEEFSTFFENNKIQFVNLLPEFVKSGQRNDLYFRRDGHWTVKGHKLVSELLTSKIYNLLK